LFLNLLAGCGFAIPSGLSAFIPLLIMSVLSNRHKLEIYGPFAWLSSWPTMLILALLVGAEVLLNKMPRMENLVNILNSVLQPLAGGLAFAVVVPPEYLPQVVTFLIGAGLARLMFLVRTGLIPLLTYSSQTAKMYAPLFTLLQEGLAFTLALLAVFVPVVAGPVALLLLAWAYFSSLRLKRKLSASK
jgi:hypothetical protein